MQVETLSIGEHTARLNTWLCTDADAAARTPIHFAHANGFNAGTYSQFLGELAQMRTVYALDHRATWDGVSAQPPKNFGWDDGAQDLIQGLEHIRAQGNPNQKFIGIGHSLGAVMTMLAALKRPDLFERIIVIEPVLQPSSALWVLRMMPYAMRHRYLPLPKMTLRRRDVWQSHDTFVEYHASKKAFGGISIQVMQDYAQHGLRPQSHSDALELVFPKSWEAHVFATLPNVWGVLKRLTVPCTCIRASDSARWIPVAAWDKWQALRPDYPVLTLQSMGHLAPLQQPAAVAQLMGKII